MRGQGEAGAVVWARFKANVQEATRGSFHRAVFEQAELSDCTGLREHQAVEH